MTHTLPELPHGYVAPKSYISVKITELHHDRHHATYVAGASAALANLEAACDAGDFSRVNQFSEDLALNLGGHTNRSTSWINLSLAGGGQPKDELVEAVKNSFGFLEKFVAHFIVAATGTQGLRWTVLAYGSISERLVVFQLFDQQANVPVGTISLSMLNTWEHALYLDYLNIKADYAKAAWDIVSWGNVTEHLEAAKAQAAGLIVR